MSNVISMSDKLQDATKTSPEQCLQDALDNLIGKHGAFKNCKKLLIIALDDTQGDYDISWSQAGMRMSECGMLCEVAKTDFLRQMGYITVD